jgi:hypothetical protein
VYANRDLLILNYPYRIKIINPRDWIILEHILFIREISIVTRYSYIYISPESSQCFTDQISWGCVTVHKRFIKRDYTRWKTLWSVTNVSEVANLSSTRLIIEVLVTDCQVGVSKGEASQRVHIGHHIFVTVTEKEAVSCELDTFI